MRAFPNPAIAGLIAFCSASLAGSSYAAVISRGEARDCYLATLQSPSPESNASGLQTCSRAIEVAPDSDARAELLVNRAFIRLRMADYTGTVADTDASLALAPNLAAADLNRGAGLIGLGRYSDALPSLERAVAQSNDGKLELAYYNRAIAREHLGDIRGAYLDYKKATELDPEFAAAKDQLSRFTVTRIPSAR